MHTRPCGWHVESTFGTLSPVQQESSVAHLAVAALSCHAAVSHEALYVQYVHVA